uniref:Aspartyl/asparaginy/proline hydroxylase domain-containing protein n=1 Tax=viral metagenome TaxID=1070528 RepID=A0A6C0I2J5_9ZZZZ
MDLFNYKISTTLFAIGLCCLLLSLLNVVRVINFLCFPNSNSNDNAETMLSYIDYEIAFQYISWLAYLFFFCILFLVIIPQTKSGVYKIVFAAILLFFICFPIFPILNIVNLLLLCVIHNPPFIKNITEEFPLHPTFESNYVDIKKEFNEYSKNKKINCFRDNNPLLNRIDTIDIEKDACWRTLYLKKTGTLVAEMLPKFPKTMSLLGSEQIHNAFFSILDPHVEIKPHVGYYKGYLRYHLGLIIPEENGQQPYLICGEEKYEWKEGKGVLFDDMFVHYVNNQTNSKRVVLYLDIKRNHLPTFLQSLVDVVNIYIENSVVMSLFIKNQHQQNKIEK